MVQTIGLATALVSTDASAGHRYVDWPAIFSGAVVASAISFVLSAVGTALGLSLVSPYEGEGVRPLALVIAIGLWGIWVVVSSFMAGAYITGRLRRRHHDATEHESDVRDGCHGLVVWAMGIFIGGMILASGTIATVNIGAKAIASAAPAAASAAEKIDYAYLGETLLRNNGTSRSIGPEMKDEVSRILQTSVGKNEVSSDDRTYLASVVSKATGISQQQATTRVDQTVAQIQKLETEARQAAEKARKASIVAAFTLAASLLIAAAGAWWAAGLGGHHRDEQAVFARFGRMK